METGHKLRGADAVIKVLAAHGVTTVFGYPGGAIMPIYDALYGGGVEHLLSRHEQGAAFAALGYARASGKTGVCFATSGPGATNLVTSLADALLDSVPMVAITGQVSTAVIGTDAFQEVDVLGMSLSCTKHSFMVTKIEDLIPTLYQAFEIAASGRPGPVLVDIPKDIQIAELEYKTPLLAVTPEPKAAQVDIDAARALLAAAQKPILYVGGGVGMAGAVEPLRDFIKATGLPSVATLKGLGAISHDTPGYLGMLGMHGTKAANLAVQECDLLVVVGARFDDRVTGRLASFACNAKVIHLDIDAAELGKLRQAEVAIAGDLREVLPALSQSLSISPWQQSVYELERSHRWDYEHPGELIYAPAMLRRLANLLPENSVVSCDVGQHQMWVAQHMWFRRPEDHLSSAEITRRGEALIFRNIAGTRNDIAVYLNRANIDVSEGVIPNSNNSPTSTSTSNSTTSSIIIPPEITTTETNTETLSNYTQPILHLRSRNIEFDVKGLRPKTKFYPFFEGVDVSNLIVPKLLEISMVSGSFIVGETIESDPHNLTSRIKFRLCSPDHKLGPFNAPTEKFKLIPFNQQQPPVNYSATSSYLNVDTRSLSLPTEIEYYGVVSNNLTLIGRTSGAVARVTGVNLISDNQGRLIGSLFIPDPNISSNPKWSNGENTFTVSDVPTLNPINQQEFISNTRVTESSAEEIFTSFALSNVIERNIITTRNVSIVPSRRVNTTTITNTNTNVNSSNFTLTQRLDPLAQSFAVTEPNGVFLTSVDIYFETKDVSLPVTLQLRTMVAGVPSTTVIPFSEVTLDPDQINLSSDSSIPTKFTFPSPVYLQGPQENQVRQSPIASNQNMP